MSFGAGTRQAFKEAFLWVIAIGFIAGSIVFSQDLSYGLSSVVQLAEDQYKETMLTQETQRTNPNYSRDFERRFVATADNRGHFFVRARINGDDIPFVADTGATYVSLSYETAEQLGFDPDRLDYSRRSRTANGIARVAVITLPEVSIGDITVRNVQALVSERGRLSTNLLGMSFMNRLNRVEMRDGKLLLVQ